MPPCGTGADPRFERRRNDERCELAGDEPAGRRGGTLLHATVAGEVRHREALRRALGAEMETGLQLDGHRNARQRGKRARLHDRPGVGPDRHRDSGRRGERRGPAARREQHAIARDQTLARPHAGDAIPLTHDLECRDVLADLHSAEVRECSESRERLDRIAVTVLRAEAATDQIVGADTRNETLDLGTLDHLDVHADALVERDRRAELFEALPCLRDEEIAALLEVMPRAGAVLEGTPERDSELRQTDIELVVELVADAAEAALARPLPQLASLEEDDIALAALGQEEGRGAADDSAADDDRRRGRHSASSSKRSLPSCSTILPKHGRAWVKPTIHFSLTARGRIAF